MESSAPSAPKLSFGEATSTQPLLKDYYEPPPLLIPQAPPNIYLPPVQQPVHYEDPFGGPRYPQRVEPVFIESYQDPLPAQSSTSVSITCDRCRNKIRTITEHSAGVCTYVSCLILCFFGCWPCYFYPFCIDSLKDIKHLCPICSNVLGAKKPCS
mmetsp:Transcript_9745/g.19060  ORF Transcript_9745/g.19060 Transcript_9745/m.19060 type:complete len:155 (-) Transcript_9745:64-528(-)